MSTLELLWRQPWMVRAGWTLVHFLWQGTLIAVLFAIVRALAGRSMAARGRYLLACLTLGLLTVTPPLTFLVQSLDSAVAPPPLWTLSGTAWAQTLPWLVVVWLGGVILFSARLIGGWRLTARLRSVAVGVVPGDWQRSLDELVARMRVSQPVRLLTSSLVAVPTVVGWLRPVILMPVEALIGLPLAQVKALLAHELAHIRRHDYLVNMLQSVAEAVLFYHPAVWWISEQIRSEREICCDDLAVEVSGDVLIYVQALAGLEVHRAARLQMVLAANGGSLLHRVRRLVAPPQAVTQQRPAPGAAWLLTVLWLTGIGVVTLHGAPGPHVQRRVFVMPAAAGVALAPPAMLEAAPEIAHPLLGALLFDPFFARPQAPAAPADAKPHARVQGKVMSVAQEPLKKASVSLFHIGSADASGFPMTYRETTDNEGKFAIENLPPGAYTLSATKSGFIQGRYGARAATDPGATITLGESTDFKDLYINLVPQAIVAGVVTDADGEPVPNARIFLYDASPGRPTEQMRISQTSTNVRGRYTYQSIPPGRYYLSATAPETGAGSLGPKELTTFYPNGLNTGEAAPLELAAGTRMEGINVRVREERVYSVKGKVIANGAPVDDVTLVLSEVGRPMTGRNVPFLSVTNGRFQYSKALPGSYILQVRGQRTGGALEALPEMFGQIEFTVKDHDVDGLVLALAPGIAVSGSFTLEDGDWQSLFTGPAADGSLQKGVSRPAIWLDSDEIWKGSRRQQPNDDGAFQMSPVAPGRYAVRVASLPPGTYIKSLLYGTRDLMTQPLDLTGSNDALHVVLSSKAATISGVVRNPNDNGAPMMGVMVTVWPRIPNATLFAGGARSVYTDQNGAFQVGNLAPGEYFAVAWEQLDTGLDQKPEFLAAFASDSFTLTESSQLAIDVKLIGRDAIAAATARQR